MGASDCHWNDGFVPLLARVDVGDFAYIHFGLQQRHWIRYWTSRLVEKKGLMVGGHTALRILRTLSFVVDFVMEEISSTTHVDMLSLSCFSGVSWSNQIRPEKHRIYSQLPGTETYFWASTFWLVSIARHMARLVTHLLRRTLKHLVKWIKEVV